MLPWPTNNNYSRPWCTLFGWQLSKIKSKKLYQGKVRIGIENSTLNDF